MVNTSKSTTHEALPPVSNRMVGLFTLYCRRYIARHTHAVRILTGTRPVYDPSRPVMVYLNHPSWWDPLVCVLLAKLTFPGRRHYAVIEADALARYPFFRRLGFVGVTPGTTPGARAFLLAGEQALTQPNAVLWVTAQGAFTDPRVRPVVLRSGIAHLARRVPGVTILPLAIEYPFWSERTPEVLCAYGQPMTTDESRPNVASWLSLLAEHMESTQDRLAHHAINRDPAAFETLLCGKAGVGGVYDLWRRARAAAKGESFTVHHGVHPS